MELNLFAITVQAVGTLLVAALLWQMTRVIPGRFLRYWSIAWVALTVSLFALRVTAGWGGHVGLVVYCTAEYVFGFLLWAGFRDYSRGHPLTRADGRYLLPFLVIGLVVPWFFSSINYVFPLHAPIMAGFFAASLWATRGTKVVPGRPPIGLTMVRVMLGALTIIFLHYGPVLSYATYVADMPEVPYLNLSPVYDALLELGLAFGMVVLAAERAQDELADTNRQLAAATKLLAEAARTDVLTGLLNRRGFEELVAGDMAAVAGAVAVLDVNDLKPLNDRFGHAAGDAALQLVARALRVHFRVTDPISRTGGDEFVVMLPTGTAADLTVRMRRIDVALRGQRLPGVPMPIDLGVAWGVEAFAPGGVEAAVASADREMYARKQARKSGRGTA